MNVGQAQADQQVSERAQQLAAEKVQLEQQQAKLARQEAELSGRQTAFEERLTAHNMTHSRLTGAALRDFSFAVSILLVLTCFDDMLLLLPVCSLCSCKQIEALSSSHITSQLLHKFVLLLC